MTKKIKKIIAILSIAMVLPLFAFTFIDGKTCRVAGTTGTVEVNAYADGSTVQVDFGNDTDVDVNVNYKITITGYTSKTSKSTQNISRTKRVPPHSTSSEIINTNFKESITSVYVTNVSGRKCE